MHSFQPSRGRILLEVFCALAVVSSMVGAWRQTHASALLVAAGAVALLAMIRLFDLGRHQPAVAVDPQPVAIEPEVDRDAAPMPVETPRAEEPVAAEADGPGPELAKPAPRTGAGRRKGGSRKSNGRRSSTPKTAEAIALVPAEEPEMAPPADATEPSAPAEPEVADLGTFEEPEAVGEPFAAEPSHVPHAPLFEPEPFVRMPRQAFGRRGRI